ncbi:hypothetical protein Scep_019846 [Stephania cephalantha]|uniref:Uncharacterized protein n=1 Tax=Stephania cephalantha TaxID=152367 RepID=A0AAP0NLT0_9MAGN
MPRPALLFVVPFGGGLLHQRTTSSQSTEVCQNFQVNLFDDRNPSLICPALQCET